MTDPNADLELAQTLARFVESLGRDAVALADALASDQPDHVRRYVAAALNYLLKSVDLIPDGVLELGYLDDALVFRMAARFAVGDGGEGTPEVLLRLAGEARVVDAVLGGELSRMADYVRSLREGTVRGRPVDALLADGDARDAVVREVRAWASAFQAPVVATDARLLIKLRAFLHTRLP